MALIFSNSLVYEVNYYDHHRVAFYQTRECKSKDFNVKISLKFFDQKILGSSTHMDGEVKHWYLLANGMLCWWLLVFSGLSAVFIG